MKPNSGVYLIRHTDSNRCYVGSSINIPRRWREHKKSLKGGVHHSPFLQKAWNKYGSSAFSFVILESCVRAEMVQREQFWMDQLTPAFNWAKASHGPVGVIRSAETRAKLRAANIGRAPANKGISPTAEQRDRQRQAQLGRVCSAATREIHRIRGLVRGRPLAFTRKGATNSDEHCAKISLAQRGQIRPAMRGRKRSFIVGFKISLAKSIMSAIRRAEVAA